MKAACPAQAGVALILWRPGRRYREVPDFVLLLLDGDAVIVFGAVMLAVARLNLHAAGAQAVRFHHAVPQRKSGFLRQLLQRFLYAFGSAFGHRRSGRR